MFIFLYHLTWTLGFILCLPIILLLRKGRFVERLALNLPSAPIGNANIWIHALSVGEVISAFPLVETLSLQYPANGIVFTVNTATGMAIAKKKLGGNVKALLTMPLDFWWCVHRMVGYVRPSVFILVETDIWPGMVDYLRRKGIKSLLVNGRISPRTFSSYRKFAFLARRIFEPFELCLMDSDLDTKRLLQIGIDSPDKVKTVGNIKFDREWEPMDQEERQNWLRLLNIEPEGLLWVAGSTHPGEEEVLIDVFKELRHSFDGLRLIIAPRAIDRSDDIVRLARAKGLNASLKAELSTDKHSYDVLVLNTLGELGRVYGLGNVSFVGGSLEPHGGHNLLEPASFGCPVLFGPHTEDFDLMSELLIEAGGGRRVQNGKELFNAMKQILSNAEMQATMGRRAKEFVAENRGALQRVISHIEACLDDAGGYR